MCRELPSRRWRAGGYPSTRSSWGCAGITLHSGTLALRCICYSGEVSGACLADKAPRPCDTKIRPVRAEFSGAMGERRGARIQQRLTSVTRIDWNRLRPPAVEEMLEGRDLGFPAIFFTGLAPMQFLFGAFLQPTQHSFADRACFRYLLEGPLGFRAYMPFTEAITFKFRRRT
jgi:hypothetical protein